MNRFRSYSIRTKLVLLIFICTLFTISISLIFGKWFFPDFVSNFIATLIGLIFGIPLGLEVDRRIEREKEKGKEREVLFLLVQEMQGNLINLEEWKRPSSERDFMEQVTNLIGGVRDEFWRALSDGGEIGCIKDPNQLHSIADAYYSISAIRHYSNLYLESLGYSDDYSRRNMNSILMRNLIDSIDSGKKSIAGSLNYLDKTEGVIRLDKS